MREAWKNGPDNILIYATSNRRHLIKEDYSDKEGTRQVSILPTPYRRNYPWYTVSASASILVHRIRKNSRRLFPHWPNDTAWTLREEELLAEANKWELSHGGLSGRTAQQFIDYLLGKQ